MSDYLDLHAMADGELDAAQQSAVRKRLEADNQCAAEFESIQRVKQILGRCQTHDERAVYAGCMKRLDEIDASRKAERFVGKYAWALCAVFLMAIVGAAFVNRNFASKTLYPGDMARMLNGLTTFGASATQPAKSWLREPMGQSQPKLSLEAVQVVGGAVGTYDARKVLRLNLQTEIGPAVLFAIENTGSVANMQPMDSSNLCQARVNSLNCVSWTMDGVAYMLFSERPFQDLKKLAERLRAK